MQFIYDIECTSEEYVSARLWLEASPPQCPWCSDKGKPCQLLPHGFYARLTPAGTRVRRFRCKRTGRTVSLLPKCLASHCPGDLDTLEEEALQAEGGSCYQAAQAREARACEAEGLPYKPCPPDPGQYRWLLLRVTAVVQFLSLVKGMCPREFGHLELTVSAFRRQLASQHVLMVLRGRVGAQLDKMPTPVGLRPRPRKAAKKREPG